MYIDFLPYPLTIGLFILALVDYRFRKRGWCYLIGLSVFGLYMMAVIFIMYFPMPLPENWPANLGWDEISYTLANTHNVNLVPFNFGNMFAYMRSGMLNPIVLYEQIGGNILLTIPFGIGLGFLTRAHGWGVVWLALGAGLALEGTQFFLMLIRVGYPHAVDINDMLLNALGVLIGYASYQMARRGVQTPQRTNRGVE